MKINKSALSTVALALLSASAVSSEGKASSKNIHEPIWHTVSEAAWKDYCSPEGSKVKTWHACVEFNPALLKKITWFTLFEAYMKPDAGGFAALYKGPDNGTSFGTDKHEVRMLPVRDSKENPVIGCTLLIINEPIYNGEYLLTNNAVHTDQKCGAEPLILPKLLWDY